MSSGRTSPGAFAEAWPIWKTSHFRGRVSNSTSPSLCRPNCESPTPKASFRAKSGTACTGRLATSWASNLNRVASGPPVTLSRSICWIPGGWWRAASIGLRSSQIEPTIRFRLHDGRGSVTTPAGFGNLRGSQAILHGSFRNQRFAKTTGRTAHAAAQDPAGSDRSIGPASGCRTSVHAGARKGSQAEPGYGVPDAQAAEGRRLGGRAGPDASLGRPALLRNAAETGACPRDLPAVRQNRRVLWRSAEEDARTN